MAKPLCSSSRFAERPRNAPMRDIRLTRRIVLVRMTIMPGCFMAFTAFSRAFSNSLRSSSTLPVAESTSCCCRSRTAPPRAIASRSCATINCDAMERTFSKWSLRAMRSSSVPA